MGPSFGSAEEVEAGISGGAASRTSGIDAEAPLFAECGLAMVVVVVAVTMVGGSLDLPVSAQERITSLKVAIQG